MNDPQVVYLRYRVEHDEDVDYSAAEPLEHEAGDFTVHVADGNVDFVMKTHFATVEEAQKAVEPFIRAWEPVA